MLKIYHSQGARSLRVINDSAKEMGVPYETAEASFFKPSDEFKAVEPAAHCAGDERRRYRAVRSSP